MAIATLGAVVLDCPDPVALAGFYAELLGGKVVDEGDGWVELVGAEGTVLAFQEAPGHVPPRWPDADAPQQFHLDLRVPVIDEAHERVVALGARVLDDNGGEPRTWRVYADLAGHPFCLCGK